MSQANKSQSKPNSILANFDYAVDLWQKNFKKFASLILTALRRSLLPFIIALAINYGRSFAYLGPIIIQWILLLLYLVAFVFIFYQIIKLELQIYLAVKANYSFKREELEKQAKELIKPYIVLKLIIGLVVALGLSLFLIPGLVLSFFLIFAPYYFVFKANDVKQAIKSSLSLVKKNWLYLLKAFLFLMLCLFAFSMISSLPLTQLVPNSITTSGYKLFLTVLALFISPIIIIYFARIFYRFEKLSK